MITYRRHRVWFGEGVAVKTVLKAQDILADAVKPWLEKGWNVLLPGAQAKDGTVWVDLYKDLRREEPR